MRRARFAHSGKQTDKSGRVPSALGTLGQPWGIVPACAGYRRRQASARRVRRPAHGSGTMQMRANKLLWHSTTRRRSGGNAGEAAVVPRITGRTGSGSLLDRWSLAPCSWQAWAMGQPPPTGAGRATSVSQSCASASWGPTVFMDRTSGILKDASAPRRRRTTRSSCQRLVKMGPSRCRREREMSTAT